MTTSTLSTLKIESILRTNCIYPEVFVERMEALYQINMQRYIAKHKSKFNFMKIGFDKTVTLEKQYKQVFPTWRDLNNKFNKAKKEYKGGVFDFLFTIHKYKDPLNEHYEFDIEVSVNDNVGNKNSYIPKASSESYGNVGGDNVAYVRSKLVRK